MQIKLSEEFKEELKIKCLDHCTKEVKGIGDIVINTVTLLPNHEVDIDYSVNGKKFERIRRITGYLSSTLDTWNDAKRCEEKDRTAHSLNGLD